MRSQGWVKVESWNGGRGYACKKDLPLPLPKGRGFDGDLPLLGRTYPCPSLKGVPSSEGGVNARGA